MKRRLVVLVCTLIVSALPFAAAAQPSRQAAVEPPQLDIRAPTELGAAAARIARLDANKLAAVMRLLGLAHAGPAINVVLATENSDIGRRTPPWIAGFADGPADLIVLFPSRTPTYPYESMEELLHHEVAHILIARAAPGAIVPRWFHEGLAMAAERTWRLEDRTRFALAIVGGRGSIGQLDADFGGSPERVARAYGVSGAFVRDLMRRHGSALPARLLARLAAGDSFDRAFVASAGTPLDEAEREFWRHSWWNQLVPFLTSTLVIWMGIVLLALYAMRRRAQHRAVLRQKWEDEERTVDPNITPSTTSSP